MVYRLYPWRSDEDRKGLSPVSFSAASQARVRSQENTSDHAPAWIELKAFHSVWPKTKV
jgi:hypothetical protein